MELGIGDWGLGIGPIPNPQSPIPMYHINILNLITNIKKINLNIKGFK